MSIERIKRSGEDLHQSEIHTFLKCAKQWEFRYVLGIKSRPKAALTVGRAVDAAISHNLTQKIATGIDLPVGDVLDICSTDFDKEAVETEWGDDDKGSEKDSAIECVQAHHKTIAPLIQPETVQEHFVVDTGLGFNFAGTMDIVEKNGVVRDSKTSKAKYGADEISRAIQPAVYDFAYEKTRGKPAAGFAYDVMVKPRQLKTKYVPVETQVIQGVVTPRDRAWVLGAAKSVHGAIKAGIATPAPDGAWWCSEGWCGYWNICKGKN